MRNATLLQLTDVHIKEGIPESEGWCAAGLAIRESLDNDRDAWVEVGASCITVEQKHGRWWAQTPPEMADFIGAFDNVVGDTGRQELIDAASAGLLQWQLTWHEGDPPEEAYGDD